ncbi:unnamed protein product [Caenorhabditis bovis]|uniref:BZIP domain-containing protein n=1 Tax=Caenorhabditis bovis TaxID=2654633 RepID=A0A8S1F072_9PELO|nr:unnamed protein product [Caenorhabditis bovis]
MDVDSASSSPRSRLSVVCSASAEYSSNSSEGSSPNSRRNSINESVIKDEHYWERRRRNNDASRRSREKRRQNDLAMEERIMQLSAENQRLKSQLESRVAKPPPIVVPDVAKNLFPANPVASLQASSMLSVPLLQTAAPPHFPLLQLMQPSIQSPLYPSTPSSSSTTTTFTASSTSAFRPVAPSASNSETAMRSDRQSPDSSTTDPVSTSVIHRVGSPAVLNANRNQGVIQGPGGGAQGPSILSALLAQRRPSPSIQQSRTEHISGLTSPPRHHSSKSDCESVSSSASLSPSHSSEDHSNYSNKSPQYVDRRRRNNEAAKRCRANRRAVFEYRSRRVQLLEGENDELRAQIESLKSEIAQFRNILAQRTAQQQ